MSISSDIALECLDFCPVCDNAVQVPFLKSRGYSIVRCNDCGLLFVNPRPSEESIRQLFVQEYIDSEERVEKQFISYRISSLRREAQTIRRLSPGGGKLLDIGTASGAFLGCFLGTPKMGEYPVKPPTFGLTG